jgi:hypothetical protein
MPMSLFAGSIVVSKCFGAGRMGIDRGESGFADRFTGMCNSIERRWN